MFRSFAIVFGSMSLLLLANAGTPGAAQAPLLAAESSVVLELEDGSRLVDLGTLERDFERGDGWRSYEVLEFDLGHLRLRQYRPVGDPDELSSFLQLDLEPPVEISPALRRRAAQALTDHLTGLARQGVLKVDLPEGGEGEMRYDVDAGSVSFPIPSRPADADYRLLRSLEAARRTATGGHDVSATSPAFELVGDDWEQALDRLLFEDPDRVRERFLSILGAMARPHLANGTCIDEVAAAAVGSGLAATSCALVPFEGPAAPLGFYACLGGMGAAAFSFVEAFDCVWWAAHPEPGPPPPEDPTECCPCVPLCGCGQCPEE